uniref:Putative reverse transcriptase domain-containing protein n=1 Tax=Tanacetum cinerariifolium TaxID=118510 RepID=A0A6L2KU79_TANCI|nr:putative reverse transcriptase domain-containing protein [Tanacetum cinerariifolium]
MANPLPLGHNADLPKAELEDVLAKNPKDDKEEELEEEESEEEEMDDPKIIHPYKEMDPHNRPTPDYDSEPEEAVAPVGRSTLKLLPPIRKFSSTFYVREGSSSTTFTANHRKVFAPMPLGKNVDALHSKVKSSRDEGSDVRTKNKKLKTMLKTAEESVEYHRKSAEYYRYNLARVSWHHHHLRRWSVEIQGLLPLHMRYRETPYVAPIVLVVPVAHDDPNDKMLLNDSSLKESMQLWSWTMLQEAQVIMLGMLVELGAKRIMIEEFCSAEEIQRLENELWNLKVKDLNITTYTQCFNELVLLCPEIVPTEKKKVEAYIHGLSDKIKGETTSSKPVNLNEVVCMAHILMEQNIEARAKRVAEGNKRRWENIQSGNRNNNNNRGNYWDNTHHHQYNNQRQGNARAMTTAQNENVDQAGPALKCDRCGVYHFNRCPIKCNKCGKVVIRPKTIEERQWLLVQIPSRFWSTTNVEKVAMQGIVAQKEIINEARKYIERGCQLFVAHVTEKEPAERRLEDVPIIRNFPEVFPDDLPGLLPPWQVEFGIELVPGVAPVARASYRLAPSEIKELANQLQELLEKGFIWPSSSPWEL